MVGAALALDPPPTWPNMAFECPTRLVRIEDDTIFVRDAHALEHLTSNPKLLRNTLLSP